MKRNTALLYLSFAMVVTANAAADTKNKTWSIGIGNKGVKVEEVRKQAPTTVNTTAGTQPQSKRTAARSSSLETDPRWSQPPPTCLTGNIDVAYVRLKKEFGYMTADERIARTPGASGDLNLIKRQGGFEYVAQPGVYYLMRDKNGRTGKRVVQTELTTEGTNRYCVSYGFANKGLANPSAYSSKLKARVFSAIN